MYSILYIEEYDDNSKIKIIELQNPWGRNKQEDAEQFALNLDEKYKYIEENIKKLKDKYMLSVKGGFVFANGIFISTICSGDNAKDLKPTLEEWKKLQREYINIFKYYFYFINFKNY